MNDKAKNVLTLVGILLAARTALTRVQQAHEDGDRFEIVDAVINVAALVTGLVVVVRRMRRVDFDDLDQVEA